MLPTPHPLKPSELSTRCANLVENDLVSVLEDFVRIPNLSRNFDSEFLTNGLLEKGCNFVIDWANKQDIKGLTIKMHQTEGRTPLVFGEVEASEGVTNSILMYGHIDKQPHLDSDWDEGLFATKPVRRGDYIYGRGVSDDGYAPFASMSIVKLLQEQGLPHPKFVFFFECDEESGSVDITYWLEHFKDRIGSPEMFVCLDSGCFDYDHWYVTSTLRGASSFTLSAQIMNKGVHSGSGGGIIPDTFRILRKLLDRLEDGETGKMTEELHTQIPGKIYLDCEKVSNHVKGSIISGYKMIETAKPQVNNEFECYLNRSQRPSMTVIGVDHLPSCRDAGNVIRPKTAIAVNIRLPPTLPLEQAKSVISKTLLANPPYGAKIDLEWNMTGQGFFAPILPTHIEDILGECAREAFDNNDIMFNHEGGSIPFMNILVEKFPESYFMVTGLLGPGSNAHAGNENIYLPMLKKLLHGMTRLCEKLTYVDFGYTGDKRPRGKSSRV